MISPNPCPLPWSVEDVPDAARVELALAATVQLGKLLADETRVRILALLAEHDELCVRTLWESLGQTQPGVSHHLALLREGGLVESHQVGRNIFYRLDLERCGELLAEIACTSLGERVLDALVP